MHTNGCRPQISALALRLVVLSHINMMLLNIGACNLLYSIYYIRYIPVHNADTAEKRCKHRPVLQFTSQPITASPSGRSPPVKASKMTSDWPHIPQQLQHAWPAAFLVESRAQLFPFLSLSYDVMSSCKLINLDSKLTKWARTVISILDHVISVTP